jgi:hypothetical protein
MEALTVVLRGFDLKVLEMGKEKLKKEFSAHYYESL